MPVATALLLTIVLSLPLSPAPVDPGIVRDEPTVDLFEMATVAGPDDAISPDVLASALAREEVRSFDTVAMPQARLWRTTSHLIVPPLAQWTTSAHGGSLLLVPRTGALRVSLPAGRARIAHTGGLNPGGHALEEIAAGEAAVIHAGERLIVHGDAALLLTNEGPTPATVTIVRLTAPVDHRP